MGWGSPLRSIHVFQGEHLWKECLAAAKLEVPLKFGWPVKDVDVEAKNKQDRFAIWMECRPEGWYQSQTDGTGSTAWAGTSWFYLFSDQLVTRTSQGCIFTEQLSFHSVEECWKNVDYDYDYQLMLEECWLWVWLSIDVGRMLIMIMIINWCWVGMLFKSSVGHQIPIKHPSLAIWRWTKIQRAV